MSIEITEQVAEVGWNALPVSAQESGDVDLDDMKAVLAAVLALPKVRQAIHDDVRRETEQKLRGMGVIGYSLEWDR